MLNYAVGRSIGDAMRSTNGDINAQTVRASNWTAGNSTASGQLGADMLITHDLDAHTLTSKEDASVAADIVFDAHNLSIVTRDVNASASFAAFNVRKPNLVLAPSAAGIASSACVVDPNSLEEVAATIHPSGFYYDQSVKSQKVYIIEIPSTLFSVGDFVGFSDLPPSLFPGGLPGIYQITSLDDIARTISLATKKNEDGENIIVEEDVAPFVTVRFGRPLSQELAGAHLPGGGSGGFFTGRVCKLNVWFIGAQTFVPSSSGNPSVSEGDLVQVNGNNWPSSITYTKLLATVDVNINPISIAAASDDVQIFNGTNGVIGITTGRPKTLAAIEPNNKNLLLEGLDDYAAVFSGVTDSVYLGNYEDNSYALTVPSGNTANVAIGHNAGRDWGGTYSTMIGAEAGAGESGGITERFTGFGKWAGSPGLPGDPLIGSDVTSFGQFGSSNSQPGYPAFDFSTRFGADFHHIQTGATKICGDGSSHCLFESVSIGFDLDIGLSYGNYFRNTKVSPLETRRPENPPSFVIPTTDSVLIGGRIAFTGKVVGNPPYTNVIALGFGNQYIHDRSLLFGSECEPLATTASSTGTAAVPSSGPIGYIPIVYRNQQVRIPVYKPSSS